MAKRPRRGTRTALAKLKDENRALHTKLVTVERLAKLEEIAFPRPALTDVGWRRVKGIQEPEYNPLRLWAYFELDDTVQGVNTKIATECTRAKGEPPESWRIVPRFAKRCAQCGTEYAGEMDECESCGNHVFLDPDPAGKAMLEDFFKNMNSDVPTDSILEDTVLCSGVLDNWYWWVREAANAFGLPVPVRVDLLDARFVRAMTNEVGALHSDEFFCPSCYWTKEGSDHSKIVRGEDHEGEACPSCGGDLAMTAWVQRDRAGKIVGRWSEREIVHGKRFGGSFRRYGLSRLVSLALIVEIRLYQRRYMENAYRTRRSWDGVLTLPMGETRGKQMLKEANEAWAQNPTEMSPLILFTGNDVGQPAGDPKWLNMMGKFTDLAPVEFDKRSEEAILTAYGVGKVLSGGQVPGQLGHPAEALEASYDSIEGEQTHVADVVNGNVVSRFPPAAQDWKWEFVSPKQRDEKLDWEVRQLKVTVAKAVNEARMDVHAVVNGEWDVEIQEGPPPAPEPSQLPGLPAFGTPGSQSPPPNLEPPEATREAPLFAERGAKQLTPRGIPGDAAVPGVRGIEDAYAQAVVERYRLAVDRAIRDAADSVQASVWQEAVGRQFSAAKADALALSEGMAARAYLAALKEERDAIPSARFEQVDEGVIERIAGPDAFSSSLEGFDREARDAIIGVIADAFATPAGLDLKAMVAGMRGAADAASWRLERIARSETTRIVNEARATQWRKYADPAAEEYEWITAEDERTDEKCRALADRNPWQLEELRQASMEFLPHPNCRCTVVRRPSLSLER